MFDNFLGRSGYVVSFLPALIFVLLGAWPVRMDRREMRGCGGC